MPHLRQVFTGQLAERLPIVTPSMTRIRLARSPGRAPLTRPSCRDEARLRRTQPRRALRPRRSILRSTGSEMRGPWPVGGDGMTPRLAGTRQALLQRLQGPPRAPPVGRGRSAAAGARKAPQRGSGRSPGPHRGRPRRRAASRCPWVASASDLKVSARTAPVARRASPGDVEVGRAGAAREGWSPGRTTRAGRVTPPPGQQRARGIAHRAVAGTPPPQGARTPRARRRAQPDRRAVRGPRPRRARRRRGPGRSAPAEGG